MLLNPKEITLQDRKGASRIYILSEIPATYAREIVSQYPISALPKVGDYAINHEMMLKLMSYVGIPQKDKAPLQLTTRELVDNHTDFKTLANLEIEMFRHNFDFFLPEDFSNLKSKYKTILTTWITQMLTASLVASSQRNAPPSTN